MTYTSWPIASICNLMQFINNCIHNHIILIYKLNAYALFTSTLLHSCSFVIKELCGWFVIPAFLLHILQPSPLLLFPTSLCKTQLILLSLRLNCMIQQRFPFELKTRTSKQLKISWILLNSFCLENLKSKSLLRSTLSMIKWIALHLPRWRVSPRHMTPIATAIAMDKGLNIATKTGPFMRNAHVWMVLFKNDPKSPCV